jgi:hypothetical protein
VVRWIFAQRLAGHSMARIARALNDTGIPCPSAVDPQRNPHRPGTGWTLGTVTTILQNPRYTGSQVWNRQRTDKDLADPANVSLGHRAVQAFADEVRARRTRSGSSARAKLPWSTTRPPEPCGPTRARQPRSSGKPVNQGERPNEGRETRQIPDPAAARAGLEFRHACKQAAAGF